MPCSVPTRPVTRSKSACVSFVSATEPTWPAPEGCLVCGDPLVDRVLLAQEVVVVQRLRRGRRQQSGHVRRRLGVRVVGGLVAVDLVERRLVVVELARIAPSMPLGGFRRSACRTLIRPW
jgi:hypothetical protein